MKRTRLSSAQVSAPPARFTPARMVGIFVLCLLLGLGTVWWRAAARVAAERNRAQTEAHGRAALLKQTLQHALGGAEVLGALVRQAGGRTTGFDQLGPSLLPLFPAAAAFELQPGGITTEVLPRASAATTIGLNAWQNPIHRPSAQAAFQSGRLAVTGPVPIDRGQLGLIGRQPVFVLGPDRREAFWGFAAIVLRIPTLLAQVNLEELTRQGFDYALVTLPIAPQKPATLALHGLRSWQDTIQEDLTVSNLKLCLALRPPDGWGNGRQTAGECLVTLLLAGLVAGLAHVLSQRTPLPVPLPEVDALTTDAIPQENPPWLQAMEIAQANPPPNKPPLPPPDTPSQPESPTAPAAPTGLPASEPSPPVDAVSESLPHPVITRAEDPLPPTAAPPEIVALPTTDTASPENTVASPESAASPPPKPKSERPQPRRKNRADGQLSLFEMETDANKDNSPPAPKTLVPRPKSALDRSTLAAQKPDSAPVLETATSKPALNGAGDSGSARPMAPPSPALLRKAVNQMLPLLSEADPGAADCLKDYRELFRSAFTPEAFNEFEQQVKNQAFDKALDPFKKMARKHGLL